jgi:DNA-binding CsgD family transcriptional regulator
MNHFGAELLGVNSQLILGDNWFENFLPSTHRHQSYKMYRLFMSEMGPGRSTYRYPIILGNGSRHEILWFHTVIVGSSGERKSSILMGQMERDSWSKKEVGVIPESNGPNDRTHLLSPKERLVAEQIRNGRTSREISEILEISRLTVDRHRNNMRRKLKIPHELRLSEYLKLYL